MSGAGASARSLWRLKPLLDFDSRTGVRQFLPDRLCLFLRNALFDRFWSGLDKVFRFFKPQRSYFTDDLNDIDLGSTRGLKNDIKLGLRLSPRRRLSAPTASSTGSRQPPPALPRPALLPILGTLTPL